MNTMFRISVTSKAHGDMGIITNLFCILLKNRHLTKCSTVFDSWHTKVATFKYFLGSEIIITPWIMYMRPFCMMETNSRQCDEKRKNNQRQSYFRRKQTNTYHRGQR